MSDEEVRRVLISAVPDLPAPPDRLHRVGELVRRRRRRRIGAASVAAVAVAALAVALPQAFGRLTLPGPDTPAASPSVAGSSAAASPPASPPPSPPAATPSGQAAPGSRPPGLAYDPARIPAGAKGSDRPRVRHTGELPKPQPDGNGIFRTVCQYSHMKPDDPLRFSGRAGASHLQLFWGNTAVGAASTPQSVAGSGRATCRGGTVDRSAYWAPALIDTRTGVPVAPEVVHVFYERGYLGVSVDEIRPMPKGLRMLAGDAAASGPQEHAGWGCADTGEQFPAIPRSCPAGTPIAMDLTFPQCWDGRNLDSADHRGHLAYARAGRGCPASHPVALPQLSYHAFYRVPPGADLSRWRLASDVYRADLPGGYGIQGGWIDGWAEDIKHQWTTGCVNKPVTCASNLLGDGREIEGDV